MSSLKKLLIEPLRKANPVTVLVLGICSCLAVTAQLKPALVMGASVTVVTALSNFIISLLRKGIPNRIRIIVQLVVVDWDWLAFWNLTALLALILAFMNIIPIPGLDGGHILFTLWEIITRRKPSDKFLTYAQNVGMFLLLALMIFANGNDLWRWLSSKF